MSLLLKAKRLAIVFVCVCLCASVSNNSNNFHDLQTEFLKKSTKCNDWMQIRLNFEVNPFEDGCHIKLTLKTQKMAVVGSFTDFGAQFDANPRLIPELILRAKSTVIHSLVMLLHSSLQELTELVLAPFLDMHERYSWTKPLE